MNEILHAGEKELTLDLDHWLGIEESRLKQVEAESNDRI